MSGAIRPVQKRSFTIAIVEDHRDTREWMRICIQEEFFVAAHETARDLLAFISANPCDLIISDISLPEMDGFALVASIRSNPVLCHQPIIAVSAHVTEADCEKVRQAGFDACLAKPGRSGRDVEDN
jgi:CheY-like chemotaxis protein